MRFGFALLRDREILRGYRDAGRLMGRAWHKRQLVQTAVARASVAGPVAEIIEP